MFLLFVLTKYPITSNDRSIIYIDTIHNVILFIDTSIAHDTTKLLC